MALMPIFCGLVAMVATFVWGKVGVEEFLDCDQARGFEEGLSLGRDSGEGGGDL